MDELGQRLTQVLQDPSAMKQIMEMASAMGFTPGGADAAQQQAMAEDAAQQVTQLIARSEKQEHRQQTLVQALLPYLNPRRQARLERAVQLSRLSRLAGSALRSGMFPTGQEGAESHV